jgi:hypothetical protein
LTAKLIDIGGLVMLEHKTMAKDATFGSPLIWYPKGEDP